MDKEIFCHLPTSIALILGRCYSSSTECSRRVFRAPSSGVKVLGPPAASKPPCTFSLLHLTFAASSAVFCTHTPRVHQYSSISKPIVPTEWKTCSLTARYGHFSPPGAPRTSILTRARARGLHFLNPLLNIVITQVS